MTIINSISLQIKKITAKLISWNFRLLFFGLTQLKKTVLKLRRPIVWTGSFLISTVVFPIFEKYLQLKNKLDKKTVQRKEKIILAATNRYIIHFLIVIITLGVASSNLLAYEERKDYGQEALVYKIVGLENFETIENAPKREVNSQTYSYLGEGFRVESGRYSQAQQQQEEFQRHQYQSELATTEGGSTLLKSELASTDAAKITRKSVQEYQIKEGDTIGGIAEKFNVSINTILWANNLSVRSVIKPGKKIIIPPASGVLHTIKQGDTLSKIAQKYRASEAKIKNFNNIGSSNLLVVGETLMVPDGQIVYTQRPRSYTSSYPQKQYSPPQTTRSEKMYWPSSCRRITQYYLGWRHTGVDIACGWSKPIRAAKSGVVSRTQYIYYGYGFNIIVNHGGGVQTLYGHLSRIYVQPGETVQKGQVIGLEGSTGYSSGPHLHFEVRINGQRVNPLGYIR